MIDRRCRLLRDIPQPVYDKLVADMVKLKRTNPDRSDDQLLFYMLCKERMDAVDMIDAYQRRMKTVGAAPVNRVYVHTMGTLPWRAR